MTGLVREIVRIHRIRQNIDHKTSFHAIGHTITTNDSAAHRKHQDVVLIQGFCGLGRPNETAISKARHQKYADHRLLPHGWGIPSPEWPRGPGQYSSFIESVQGFKRLACDG